MSEVSDIFCRSWRLIDTGHCSASANMAVDEAISSLYVPGCSLPVLRLYGWHPPAISMGRFQDAADDLDLERCTSEKLAVVRRITGGSAIFHADELTYSLVCSPDQIPGVNGVKDSFRFLTSFLLGFYQALGLQAGYAVDLNKDDARLGQRTPLCFAGQESYDILINGRKIGGNAQRRSRRMIFQHGSIPLKDRVHDSLVYLKQVPVALNTTSLQAEGVIADLTELKHLLLNQFEQKLGAVLTPDSLAPAEQQLAKQLEQGKYASDVWNLKGQYSEDTT